MRTHSTRFWLPVSLITLSLAPARAQSALNSLSGAASERLGAAAVAAGDHNGDGIDDVLVGVPNAGFQGEVRCISGAYLASGTGTAVLWTATPGVSAGSAMGFGAAITAPGDLTGDGIGDFVVGAPNLDYAPVGTNCGAVYLLNGATHQALKGVVPSAPNRFMGTSLATVRDVDGDGRNEVVVGSPGVLNVTNGAATVLSGADFAALSNTVTSVTAPGLAIGGVGLESGAGTCVASGFDLDGDGLDDVAIGSPWCPGPAGQVEAGAVWIMKAMSLTGDITSSSFVFANYRSTTAGEHFGQSVDAKHDYNGDGVVDVIIGAPNKIGGVSAQEGRALVASGAAMLANAAVKDLLLFPAPQPNPAPTAIHFGTCVRASDDLNGDGIGEIMIGAPDYAVTLPSGPGRGAVVIYSGASGLRMGSVVGSNLERLGDTIVGAFDDLDGDGWKDFAVAGSWCDTPATDCGKLRAYRLFPAPPSTYCTGKTNSAGCVPSMSWSGSASASSTSSFLVTCSSTINQKTGFLTYSYAPKSAPYQGGTVCITAPIQRTPAQMSGGSATGNDCTGAYAYDFNARIQSGVDPALIVGVEVYAQYRARDPLAAFSSALSNAVRFMVNP